VRLPRQGPTDFGGVALPSQTGFQTGLFIGAGVALAAAAIATFIPNRASLAAEENIDHAGREADRLEAANV
jgi:hypothetical protein